MYPKINDYNQQLMKAMEVGWEKIEIHSSNKQLTTKLQARNCQEVTAEIILEDKFNISAMFQSCSFCFVSSKDNLQSIDMAKQVLVIDSVHEPHRKRGKELISLLLCS